MGSYTLLIAGTLIGFLLLAALLLVPVWRFLEREKTLSEEWTPDEIAKRLQERRSTSNGSEAADDEHETTSSPS